MADAGAPPVDIGAPYTELPDEFPQSVRDLATEVTAGQPTDYQKAVALQQFFRRDGRFELHHRPAAGQRRAGPGLVPRRGHRARRATASSSPPRWRRWPAASTSRPGWWSASSAVSRWRRTSGSTPPATCTPGPSSTSTDSGWVKFEPTPSGRAPAVPSYTTDRLASESDSAAPSTGRLGHQPAEQRPAAHRVRRRRRGGRREQRPGRRLPVDAGAVDARGAGAAGRPAAGAAFPAPGGDHAALAHRR